MHWRMFESLKGPYLHIQRGFSRKYNRCVKVEILFKQCSTVNIIYTYHIATYILQHYYYNNM